MQLCLGHACCPVCLGHIGLPMPKVNNDESESICMHALGLIEFLRYNYLNVILFAAVIFAAGWSSGLDDHLLHWR